MARYNFYSVAGAVALLLNLKNSGSSSNPINEVAVAHLLKWQAIVIVPSQ